MGPHRLDAQGKVLLVGTVVVGASLRAAAGSGEVLRAMGSVKADAVVVELMASGAKSMYAF